MARNTAPRSALLLAFALALPATPVAADERATPPAATTATEAPKAAAADANQPLAPSAAYVIDENEKSQMAKRTVPGGWREVKVRESVYWCQQTKQFGSRTRAEERCMTPDQYDQLQRDSAKFIEQTRAKERPSGAG